MTESHPIPKDSRSKQYAQFEMSFNERNWFPQSAPTVARHDTPWWWDGRYLEARRSVDSQALLASQLLPVITRCRCVDSTANPGQNLGKLKLSCRCRAHDIRVALHRLCQLRVNFIRNSHDIR